MGSWARQATHPILHTSTFLLSGRRKTSPATLPARRDAYLSIPLKSHILQNLLIGKELSEIWELLRATQLWKFSSFRWINGCWVAVRSNLEITRWGFQLLPNSEISSTFNGLTASRGKEQIMNWKRGTQPQRVGPISVRITSYPEMLHLPMRATSFTALSHHHLLPKWLYK